MWMECAILGGGYTERKRQPFGRSGFSRSIAKELVLIAASR
jgi:hypothetical protein